MTTRTAITAGVGAVVLAAGGFATANQLDIVPFSATAAATTVSVPAPQNLRAYEVGPDYVKVSFGPSIVGPMQITPTPNGRAAKITWGGATDALYPLGITYEFSKNGKVLWTGRQQTYANVGFTLTVRGFTTCVLPHSTSGFGPKRCVKWTAP